MASPIRYRKLMEASTNFTTIFISCVIQCDQQINPTGRCSSDCTVFCPSFCHAGESSPTPSPATSPYTLPTPPDHHHHTSLSLPLKISLIFLIATSIYALYKFYAVCFRSSRHRTAQPPPTPENQETDVVDHHIWYIRTTGLQLSVINAITVLKFSKIDGVVEGTDCSVCLSEFEEDDTIRLLPNCKHAFHISCIDTWLRSHTNCPLCRAGIVNNTVDEPSPEQNDVDLGETSLGFSIMRDGDRGEGTGTFELGIGETDEQELNNNSPKREG